MNNLLDAIGDYSKAIELNDDNENLFFLRGLAKYKLDDYQGALADYSKEIELNPRNKKILQRRSDLYAKLSEIDKYTLTNLDL